MAVEAETHGWDTMSDTCKANLFPVSAGGNGDEKVTCTVFDQVNEFIIVAGQSNSDDFAPAANDHAFVYAVDLDANWMWGKFFYNVSYAVSSISGCHLDDEGTLNVLGLGASEPVVMQINPLNG